MNRATTAYPVHKEQKYICKPTSEVTTPADTQTKEQKQQRKFREGKIVRTRHHIGHPVQSEGTRPLTPSLTRQYIKKWIESQRKKYHDLMSEHYGPPRTIHQCTCKLVPDFPVPTVATVPAGNLIEQTQIDLLVVGLIYPPRKPTTTKTTPWSISKLNEQRSRTKRISRKIPRNSKAKKGRTYL